MNILVVEDEVKISNLIKKGLEMGSHKVSIAYDGEKALKMAMKKHYDAILMDIMIPKITGLEVTKKLREEKIETPIIMLTARDSAEEKVRGFEAGADDYMVKPFIFAELLRRIKALPRQGKS